MLLYLYVISLFPFNCKPSILYFIQMKIVTKLKLYSIYVYKEDVVNVT